MKFRNLENDSIIVVDKKDVTRIEKLKGYPDKFEIVEEENNEPVYFKNEEIENNIVEEEKPKKGKKL